MSEILTFIILQKTIYYHKNYVLFYTFAYTNKIRYGKEIW